MRIASEKVRNNTKVVEAAKQPLPFMIHMTPDHSNKAYIPRIGTKQGYTEDRTMPRVTVADTLIGCLIGYACLEEDFFNRNQDKAIAQRSKNGYRINRLDYDFCLRPNARLVYDVQATNEHWLISYNKDTIEYKPTLAAYMVVGSITVMQHPKYDDPDSIITCFVDVREKSGIYLAEDIHLEQGYYSFTVCYNRHITFDTKLSDKLTMRKISRSEFQNRKLIEVSTESLKPAYMKW